MKSLITESVTQPYMQSELLRLCTLVVVVIIVVCGRLHVAVGRGIRAALLLRRRRLALGHGQPAAAEVLVRRACRGLRRGLRGGGRTGGGGGDSGRRGGDVHLLWRTPRRQGELGPGGGGEGLECADADGGAWERDSADRRRQWRQHNCGVRTRALLLGLSVVSRVCGDGVLADAERLGHCLLLRVIARYLPGVAHRAVSTDLSLEGSRGARLAHIAVSRACSELGLKTGERNRVVNHAVVHVCELAEDERLLEREGKHSAARRSLALALLLLLVRVVAEHVHLGPQELFHLRFGGTIRVCARSRHRD
mmetsp:Transcript_25301/g.65359  ORF Transcript_25301/g.65359 Transcript_25301/m.65359 type:complete len:308 (+) Transcript_25301:156-1079(+)